MDQLELLSLFFFLCIYSIPMCLPAGVRVDAFIRKCLYAQVTHTHTHTHTHKHTHFYVTLHNTNNSGPLSHPVVYIIYC